MKPKLSPVAQAYERCRSIRRALLDAGRCLETTEDKAGIVWERYTVPSGKILILFATPHWCDVFAPLTEDQRIDAAVEAIKACAAKPDTP